MRSVSIVLLKNIFLFGLVVFILQGCDDNDSGPRNYSESPVWRDEFNGPAGTLPSSTNWNFDIGNGTDGWGNQELQDYTMDPANVSMDGEGNLRITAIRNGSSYTSARINTAGKAQFTYGRFEAGIRTPYGPGIWPAFWLLGNPGNGDIWPEIGEIDIMELRGQEPSSIAGSIHGPGYSAGNAITTDFELENDRFDEDYYQYAVDWGPGFIEFFVNGEMYQRITPEDVPGKWVYDHDFFIILNVAVGGTYVGLPAEQTPFPQTMYIDYVRYYTF